MRARESFFVAVPPPGRMVRAGELVKDGDPIVKGREHLFGPDGEDEAPVERATAAPGEKRLVRRPRK